MKPSCVKCQCCAVFAIMTWFPSGSCYYGSLKAKRDNGLKTAALDYRCGDLV